MPRKAVSLAGVGSCGQFGMFPVGHGGDTCPSSTTSNPLTSFASASPMPSPKMWLVVVRNKVSGPPWDVELERCWASNQTSTCLAFHRTCIDACVIPWRSFPLTHRQPHEHQEHHSQTCQCNGHNE